MLKETELNKLNISTPPEERKYRIGGTFKKKDGTKWARMLTYIDARYIMDKLDLIVGPENWSNKYFEIKGNLFCEITIRFIREDGTIGSISKMDCGTESNVEKQKGEASDAFKRAAVHFGLARDLYVTPTDSWSMAAELDTSGKYLKDRNWKPKVNWRKA